MKALGVRELTYKLSFLASSVEPKSARGIADDDEMDDDDDVSACWWHVFVKHFAHAAGFVLLCAKHRVLVRTRGFLHCCATCPRRHVPRCTR